MGDPLSPNPLDQETGNDQRRLIMRVYSRNYFVGMVTVLSILFVSLVATTIVLAVQLQSRPAAQSATRQPSDVVSVTWSVANEHPTARQVADCAGWLPVIVYTKARGVTTDQPACDPNRSAQDINDELTGALAK